jgi:hypothetical protein
MGEVIPTMETTAKAAMDPTAPGQTPTPAAGAKRVATPSGSTLLAKRPYKGVWKPRFIESPVIYFLYLVVVVAFLFLIEITSCAAHRPPAILQPLICPECLLLGVRQLQR